MGAAKFLPPCCGQRAFSYNLSPIVSARHYRERELS